MYGKKVKVKICGITNIADAQAAAESGADMLGFVLYRKSPRYISLEKAAEICRGLPKYPHKVGVFVNELPAVLDKILKMEVFDFFQFSGDEMPELCSRYPGKIIKTFRIDKSFSENMLNDYSDCTFHLFDAGSDRQYGGTGKTVDWNRVSCISMVRPVILAGGLTCENVKQAITTVQPFMVDVSSGVEREPGEKDHTKIRNFIRTAGRRT